MSWLKINGQKLTAIADAIRGKTGGTEKLGLDGMADGVDAVFTKGKQAQYDAFWDAFQENGTRIKYEFGFAGHAWNDETFKPKYDIILGTGYTGQNLFWSSEISNLAETLEKQGVRLDTTNCGHAQSMFQNTITTRIPELNFSHAHEYNSGNGLYLTFINSAVKTIDKLIVTDKLKYNSTFNGCSNLENITFEGVIGNSLSFANSSKLTNASVQSIIDCLKDLTGATSQTLTLHATVKGKLTEEQRASIAGKNWSVA